MDLELLGQLGCELVADELLPASCPGNGHLPLHDACLPFLLPCQVHSKPAQQCLSGPMPCKSVLLTVLLFLKIDFALEFGALRVFSLV